MKLQTKKIEELILYLIEKEEQLNKEKKTIQTLVQQIGEQQKTSQSLQKQINQLKSGKNE